MNNSYDFTSVSYKLAVVAALIMILAILGHRLSIVAFQPALLGLALGTLIGLLAIAFGLFEMIRATKAKKTQKTPIVSTSPAAGSTLGLLVVAPIFVTLLAGIGTPMIHDITTDLEHPPEFIAIKALRAVTDNSLERNEPENLAALQKQSYPDLVSLLLDRPFETVFEQAVALVKKRGWEVTVISAANGRIEATDTTLIMGFKDDVIIRIEKKGKQTQVDMRSVSRVGKGDLGTNAARIRSFLDELGKD